MNKRPSWELDGGPNTDDDFFGMLRNRSNLDLLFDIDTNQDEQNQTLKYQPVKQKQQATSSPAKHQSVAWQTQLAKVVNAYRAGESIGKLGAALLQKADGSWKLILYKTKTQVLSTVTLLPPAGAGFELQLQSRYLQYYDDERIYWSLLFDKAGDEHEFLDKLQAIGVSVQQQPSQVNDETQVKELPKVSSELGDTSHSVTPAQPAPTIHSKTALISRMAKMGQQLPKFNATEYSDSSDTEVLATPGALGSMPKRSAPAIAPRLPRSLPARTEVVPLEIASSSTDVGIYNGPTAGMETQFMQMLLTENRTQNSEMRMNINKLEGKLEKVLDKMDCLHSSSTATKSNKDDDEILELEEKMLELKKENRKLKQNLAGRAHNNGDQLQQRLLREFNDELSALGLGAVDDLSQLLAELLDKVTALQQTVAQSEVALATAEQKVLASERGVQAEISSHAKTRQETDELAQQVQQLTTAAEQHEQQLQQTLKAEQDESAKRLAEQMATQTTATASTVKTIMNRLYGKVASELDVHESVDKESVLALLGKTIREETLKAIGTTSN